MASHSSVKETKSMPRTEEANQRIREERKEQVIWAAAQVFARKGLSDTRIVDIAAAAGISHGLAYRYFPEARKRFLPRWSSGQWMGQPDLLRQRWNNREHPSRNSAGLLRRFCWGIAESLNIRWLFCTR